jgi:F-type H+-transporting ATPase subunit gamma
MRSIKRRIRSVGSTQQITRAMNLVAASKLAKARASLESARPFCLETESSVKRIAAAASPNNPYFKAGQNRKLAIIVITGDRGLCGGYNVNASKAGYSLIKDGEGDLVISVGVKGRDYFRRRRRKIIRSYSGVSEMPFYEDAYEIGMVAMDLFKDGEVGEVHLVYTKFLSTMTHETSSKRLLPIESGGGGVMDFEPSEDDLLTYLVPKYISTVIYGAMLESSACEQSARMTGMDSATKNSVDLINSLSLQYNRARQDAITAELTEIVSGANAL